MEVKRRYLFTSESVTEGHPDKVADRISDALVDAYLEQDPFSRVAAETIVFTGGAFVTGQITSRGSVSIPDVVREAVREIGYDSSWGYDPDQISVLVSIDRQSPDIAMGVDRSLEVKEGEVGDSDYWEKLGAGDQGIMFGYASNETPQYMPLPISLAHALAKRLADVRKSGVVDFLGPDGKTQVTILYEDDKPLELVTLVTSVQHRENVSLEQVREAVMEHVIKPILRDYVNREIVPPTFLNPRRVLINPTGRFVIGGPVADTGLTGRKVIVDTYGGSAHNGGGCFSGKDPTKVDRTGSYAARYIAKNIVAAGLADRCEVQLSYVIGVAKPTSIYVNTYGTGKVSEELIEKKIEEILDLRPGAIIKRFQLYRPIYKPLSAYGHFGREDLDLPWEKLDMVEELRSLLKMGTFVG